jgi:hypothetical protein
VAEISDYIGALDRVDVFAHNLTKLFTSILRQLRAA